MQENIEKIIKRLATDILSNFPNAEKVNVYKGSAGEALLFSLLCKYEPADANQNHLYNSISHCINNIKTLEGNASLSGYSGVLLTLSILLWENQLEQQEIQEVLNVLQNLVIESIPIDFQTFNLDFLHGLTGKLIVLTESKKLFGDDIKFLVEENIIKGIEYIVNNAKHINNREEIFWENQYTSKDIINTGLAHGLAGVINFLARAYGYDFIDNNLKQKIKDCLFSACNFLINRRSLDHSHFTFLNKLSISGKKLNTAQYYLAWCNGDLGIVFSLIEANKCLKSEKLDGIIHSIIKSVSKVRKFNSGIRQDTLRLDTTLCHGSFGAFFWFYLLYKSTKITEAKNAYFYWLNESLSQIDWNKKLLGLSHCNIDPVTGSQEWDQANGFLFGATGQCLCLLSFLLLERDTVKVQHLNWLKFLF